jgi:cytochrome oxidase assembly protein ShyY1
MSHYTRSGSPAGRIRLSRQTRLIGSLFPLACFSLAYWQYGRYQQKVQLASQLAVRRHDLLKNDDVS